MVPETRAARACRCTVFGTAGDGWRRPWALACLLACLPLACLRLAACGLRLAACRLPLAACRLPLAACRLPLAACRLPLAACRLPLAACRLPLAACRLPLAACRLPLAACRLPLAACRLPLAACRLPLAACRLPLAACGSIIVHRKAAARFYLHGARAAQCIPSTPCAHQPECPVIRRTIRYVQGTADHTSSTPPGAAASPRGACTIVGSIASVCASVRASSIGVERTTVISRAGRCSASR